MTNTHNHPFDICLSDGFDYLFPVDEIEAINEAREIKLAEYDVLNSLIEG